jgi:hypothetical protein
VLEKLEGKDLSKLFVKEIRVEIEGYGTKSYSFDKDFALAQSRYSVEDIVKSNFKGVQYVGFCNAPNLLGHLPLSKFDNDLSGQQEMTKALLALHDVKVYGEFEDSSYDLEDQAKEFDETSNDGERYTGDYSLIHGNSYYCEEEGECEYIDGRVSNNNESVIEDFWSFGFNEDGYLSELDPKESICIYHRKGKDWYVGYTLEERNLELCYFDGDEVIEWEEFYTLTFTPNKELLEKVVDVVKGWKEDVEVRGFINNELEIGGCSYDSYYNQGIVNKKLVEFMYDDVQTLREEIEENLTSWKEDTIAEEFTKAYNKAIEEKVKVLDNLKVEITHTVSSYSSQDNRKENYNHLRILKALGKRFDYQLVHSEVSIDINTIAWAIKKDNEEYHFDIASVIADDIGEENSLREFLSDALAAIEKRKLEKISQAELFEKASHVFVGIDDSIKSGNCQLGTSQFVTKHQINTSKIGGLRGDLLLELENSNFTKRAVMQAIASHGHVE